MSWNSRIDHPVAGQNSQKVFFFSLTLAHLSIYRKNAGFFVCSPVENSMSITISVLGPFSNSITISKRKLYLLDVLVSHGTYVERVDDCDWFLCASKFFLRRSLYVSVPSIDGGSATKYEAARSSSAVGRTSF